MKREVFALLILVLLLLGAWWGWREEDPGLKLLGYSLVPEEDLMLELSYSTRVKVVVHLFGPGGEEMDNAILLENSSTATLLFSTRGHSPRGGTYRLFFEYRGKKIAENLLSFSGPRVEVGEVSLGWRGESWPLENLLREIQRLHPGEDPERRLREFIEWLQEDYPWADREKMLENHSLNFYELRSVKVELLNVGDLPAYVTAVRWKFENTAVGGRTVDEWLEPVGREWEWDSYFLSLPGTRMLGIEVLESWDKILVEDSRPLSIP